MNNINNILCKGIPDINQLLDNLKKLLEYYPAINEFNQVKEPLFSIDDFEIAKKPKNIRRMSREIINKFAFRSFSFLLIY